jgi:multidrug resistance efflux pump
LTPFDRSLRSLEVDSWHRSAIKLVVFSGLLLAWGSWAWAAKISLYEATTDGRLEVLSEARPVSAETDGRVIRTELTVGRPVTAGEVLAEIDVESGRLTVKEHQTQIEDLSARGRALDKEIQLDQRALIADIAAGASARSEADARAVEAEVRAALAREEADRPTHLPGRSPFSEEEVSRRRADAEAASAAADAERFSAERVARSLAVDSADRAKRIAELRRVRLELGGAERVETARVNALDYDVKRHIVRAPISGRIGEVRDIREGSFVHAGDRVATIIPADTDFHVVSLFPDRLIGRIRVGQPATLRLHGYPWIRYGTLSARVEHVGNESDGGMIRVDLGVARDQKAGLPLEHGLSTDVAIEVETTSPWTLLLLASTGRTREPVGNRQSVAAKSPQ